MKLFRSTTMSICLLAAFAGSALAAEPVQLVIKNNRFTPDTVKVPTGTRIKVEISNHDDTPAEFESTELKAEKIIVPGGKISVFVGPLKPGTYKFIDEYHPETAFGTMTAVETLASE